jgi:hypothetical protein
LGLGYTGVLIASYFYAAGVEATPEPRPPRSLLFKSSWLKLTVFEKNDVENCGRTVLAMVE